jgi:hypothetical protein
MTSQTSVRGPANRSAPPARSSWHRYSKNAASLFRDHGSGNLEIEQYNGLILKASYWRWPERGMAGNGIDFYVKVLGASFHDAMKQLMT